MTIAAGFTCSDGLLICADTQVSGGGKFDLGKIRRVTIGDFLECVVAGAGNLSFIGMAVDMIEELLHAKTADILALPTGKERCFKVRRIVRSVIRTIHQNHIAGYPYGDPKPQMELILGSHFMRDDECSELLYVGADGGVTDTHEAVIGIGAEIARSYFRILHQRQLNLDTMVRLCIFVLYQTKRSAEACGGSTECYRLPSSGSMRTGLKRPCRNLSKTRCG